jgi:hypothetical protein
VADILELILYLFLKDFVWFSGWSHDHPFFITAGKRQGSGRGLLIFNLWSRVTIF